MSSEPNTSGRSRAGLLLNLGVGLLISAVCFVAATRGTSLEQLRAAFGAMGLSWLLVGFAAQVGAHGLRLWRWVVALRRVGPIEAPVALDVGALGCMATFVLPARLGELVRPTLIAQTEAIGAEGGVATIVIERLVDGVFISLGLVLALALLPTGATASVEMAAVYGTAGLFASASLGLLFGALLYPRLRGGLEAMLGRVSGALAERVSEVLGRFFEAVTLVGRSRAMVAYLAYTVGIWGLTGASLWAFCAAAPEVAGVATPGVALLVMCLAVLGSAIPSAPTNLGVFHWAVVFGLGLFGVAPEQGLAVGTVFHLAILGGNLLYGALGWAHGTWTGSLRELARGLWARG